MLKALFVFEILTFCLDFIGYVGKRLDKRVSANSKIHDVVDWATNNYNAHITQYLKKKGIKYQA